MVKARKSSVCSYGSDSREEQKNEKFSVYDFGDADKRVEKESKEKLHKYKPYRSLKFFGSHMDKYCFLRSFSQGAKTHGTFSRSELLDIEDSNDNVEQMNCVSSKTSMSDSKESAYSSVEHCYPGAYSYFLKGKRPARRTSFDAPLKLFDPHLLVNNHPLSVDSSDDQGNRNLLPISVDSDDDCKIELGSSISAPYLSGNKASVEEQPSDHDSDAPDAEVVVNVKPNIIIFGEMYLMDTTLAFSDRYVKVERSTVGGMDTLFILNWSVSDIVKIESYWYKEVETARVVLYLKSRNEKLAKASEFVKLEFAICDPCWSERQEAIVSLHTIYKATWNTVTDSNKAFEGIIYPQGDPDAVLISMKDVQLLQPATFINDTIIDFYVKYLEQKLEPGQRQRFHFFNSFFFRKLVDEKYASTAFDGRAAFQRVCKWTRKVNLFEKDYLFIPVNFSLHWSLIVVCHPGEVACYEDKEMEKPLKYPCILHMDSIRRSHRGLKNVFQSYLLEEWKERPSKLSEDVSDKFLNLPFKSLELPQQENSYDCGLFLLYFVERFLEEAPINFSPHAAASKFLNKKWFPPAEASGRRNYIKNILYRIIKENVQKGPPIMNYLNSPQNEIQGAMGKELQQTCSGGNMQNYYTPNVDKTIPTTLQETTNIRCLQYAGRPNLLPGGSSSQVDTGCSVMEGTYEHCRKLESLKQFRGILSPMEEEETEGKRTDISWNIACTRFSERNLIAPSMQCEDMMMKSETVVCKFPIEDDENLVPEKPFVCSSEERTGGNGPFSLSSEEHYSPVVVEDSYESEESGVNENGNHAINESRSFPMSDQVVGPACNTDVKHKSASIDMLYKGRSVFDW